MNVDFIIMRSIEIIKTARAKIKGKVIRRNFVPKYLTWANPLTYRIRVPRRSVPKHFSSRVFTFTRTNSISALEFTAEDWTAFLISCSIAESSTLTHRARTTNVPLSINILNRVNVVEANRSRAWKAGLLKSFTC